MDETTPIRVLLYSHDSQGLGHVRRNLANYIAYAEFRISDGMSTSGLC